MDASFAKEDWERYATVYDVLGELRPYARMLDDVAAIVRNIEFSMLDAGCGTGNLIARLPTSHRMRIVGIDASRAMLERAKKKSPETSFEQADLDRPLPFRSGTFGAVACINALYAALDPAATLREFFRVLRPSGSLVIVTPKLGYDNGLILKSHCNSEKPDAYWSNLHENPDRERSLILEAVREPVLADKLVRVARFNQAIARERSFRFFSDETLPRFAHVAGFAGMRVVETYAGQNLLLTAYRV